MNGSKRSQASVAPEVRQPPGLAYGVTAGYTLVFGDVGTSGVIHAGDEHASTRWLVGPHTHPVWEFYLQLDSRPSVWRVAGRSWSVGAREMLAVPPDTVHELIEAPPAKCHFYYAAFDPDVLLRGHDVELAEVWQGAQAWLAPVADSAVLPFEAFLREVTHLRAFRDDALILAAKLLMVEITRLAAARLSGASLVMQPSVAQAANLIESNLREPLSVAELAQAVHLSVSRFSALFAETTGETPGRYQARVRIERARTLLRETDLSISQIAEELGYSSPQHLATSFRAGTGMTPSQFRGHGDAGRHGPGQS